MIIPLVGPPKPRTKSKNSPTYPGTEKSGAKVVILGELRARFRVLELVVMRRYSHGEKNIKIRLVK